jgi:hypothetical protein
MDTRIYYDSGKKYVWLDELGENEEWWSHDRAVMLWVERKVRTMIVGGAEYPDVRRFLDACGRRNNHATSAAVRYIER